MEDDARRRVLARRAYFVAAALAGLGACQNATEHEPVRAASARPTEDAGSDAGRDEPDADASEPSSCPSGARSSCAITS